MRTREFWLDALERAVRTGAQAVLALWPTTAAVLDGGTNWELIGYGSALAAGFSLLTSIVGSQVGNPTSASMLPAEDEP